jgi:hypothetical protein
MNKTIPIGINTNEQTINRKNTNFGVNSGVQAEEKKKIKINLDFKYYYDIHTS